MSKIKKLSIFLLLILITVPLQSSYLSENLAGKVFEVNAESAVDLKIISPRLMQPEIKLKGTSFVIKVRAPNDAGGWEVKIFTEYRETSLVLESAEYEPDSDLWLLEALIPIETAEDLYDLEVRLIVSDGTQTLTEYNAVQVLEKYPKSFTILVISDSHIIPGATSGIEKFTQAILQANLIHPAFILFPGDLVEAGTALQFQYFKELCKNLQVPVFAAGGNHDLSSGTTNYVEEISSLYYTFEYGDAFFIMACTWGNASFGSTQLEWIENQLASHQDSSLKVISMHYPVWDYGSWNYYLSEAEEFTEICWEYSVDLVLYGHLHNDDVRTVGGTTYILTTAISGSVWTGNVNGYRIIKIQDYDVVDYSYDGENLSQPVAGMYVERVPEDTHILDRGLRLKITNNLLYPLENLRIKAVLKPLVDDKYLIFNAAPLSTFNSSIGCLVVAECDVPVDSSVEVTIHPSNPSAPNIVDVSYPMEVEVQEFISVEAKVENDISGVGSVELFYTSNEEDWNKIPMGYSGNNIYSATIPAQSAGTSYVELYVAAKDFSGLEATSEVNTITFVSEEKQTGLQIPAWVAVALLVSVAFVSGFFIVRFRKKRRV